MHLHLDILDIDVASCATLCNYMACIDTNLQQPCHYPVPRGDRQPRLKSVYVM